MFRNSIHKAHVRQITGESVEVVTSIACAGNDNVNPFVSQECGRTYEIVECVGVGQAASEPDHETISSVKSGGFEQRRRRHCLRRCRSVYE